MSMASLLGLRWKMFAPVLWITSLGLATTSLGQVAVDDGAKEVDAATIQEAISGSDSEADTVGEEAKEVLVQWDAILCYSLPGHRIVFELDGKRGAKVGDPSSRSQDSTELALTDLATQKGFGKDLSDLAVTRRLLATLNHEGYLSRYAEPRVLAKSGRESLYTLTLGESRKTICLSVTPIVHEDTISMDIKSDISWEDEPSSRSSREGKNNGFTTCYRRTVSTKANIKDGKTIVITCPVPRYVLKQGVNYDSGLSDIPLIGMFLGMAEKQQDPEEQEEVELAFFISPSIVR